MIPLKDMTPRQSFPVMTLLLIGINIAVFVHQLMLPGPAGELFIKTYGLVPAKISLALAGRHYTLEQALIPLFTCMFLHGGFLHIIGNMWFLWIFGANVEDRMGPLPYLLFYLICGLGSGLSEVAFSWGSHIPSIGASGAISGVLGAYILLFPKSRIMTLVLLIIIPFLWKAPAVIFIGLWFLMQFLSGVASLHMSNNGGVAWWAHVGGFLLGLLLVRAFATPKRTAYYAS
jgi:membrane associated rhomboid family serine protease